MPSFRARLDITGLRPDYTPPSVMEAATAAVGSSHVVEGHQLDVVGGVPRITVRFTVEPGAYDDENRQALRAARHLQDAVEEVAHSGNLTVLRRVRGRWHPLT
ncbi:hypothetical protein [Arthrobacter sp. USHLN218]|uniref:hypothetical protein n=1 Tax=Arthrobacter sp. USHLN218 TaxID=3081232 RepID=UPI0030198137